MKFRNLSNGIPAAPNGSHGFQLPPLEGRPYTRPYTRPYHDFILLPTIFQPSSNYLQLPSSSDPSLTLSDHSQAAASLQDGSTAVLPQVIKNNGTSILTICSPKYVQKEGRCILDIIFRGSSNTMSIWFVREDGSNLCKNGKVKREFRPSTFNLILSTLILLYSIRTICV